MNDVQWRGLLDFLKERQFHVGKDPYQLAYVKAMADACGKEGKGSSNAIFVDSPAGTGKTTLAVLTGVYAVKIGILDKIIYLRTENNVGGEERGALPGNDDEKFSPYRAPFVEAMDEADASLWEQWSGKTEETRMLKQYGSVDKSVIERQAKAIATHPGYFRGKTRAKVFAIIDEAQNWRKSQLQAVYTRFKNNAVIVTIGHSGQVDLPQHQLERVGALLPFQVFALHHMKKGAWVGFLQNNYRGEFAQWSDEVDQTIAEIEKHGSELLFVELLKSHHKHLTA